ncbi:hypothetical protein CmeUKMEL1_13880 [Cryptosporidium meleagridis]|uniref:Integral membrane protein n=1 Tax=Cryptosporidium meleagridis TaxID=93969 RepID=A0A2P4Z3T0_9CRYT|nr:hypothetical protein CmeUKMEL1_13880 [Cryptosporidium meleagridis]
MSLIKLVIFFLFSIAESIKPENYVPYLTIIYGNTKLNLEISENIHTIEQQLKESTLNSTLNSINTTASEELSKGMLGYANKHRLDNFKNPKELENVLEYRNSSDLEINSDNATENNSTSEIKMSLANENEIKKKTIELPLFHA